MYLRLLSPILIVLIIGPTPTTTYIPHALDVCSSLWDIRSSTNQKLWVSTSDVFGIDNNITWSDITGDTSAVSWEFIEYCKDHVVASSSTEQALANVVASYIKGSLEFCGNSTACGDTKSFLNWLTVAFTEDYPDNVLSDTGALHMKDVELRRIVSAVSRFYLAAYFAANMDIYHQIDWLAYIAPLLMACAKRSAADRGYDCSACTVTLINANSDLLSSIWPLSHARTSVHWWYCIHDNAKGNAVLEIQQPPGDRILIEYIYQMSQSYIESLDYEDICAVVVTKDDSINYDSCLLALGSQHGYEFLRDFNVARLEETVAYIGMADIWDKVCETVCNASVGDVICRNGINVRQGKTRELKFLAKAGATIALTSTLLNVAVIIALKVNATRVSSQLQCFLVNISVIGMLWGAFDLGGLFMQLYGYGSLFAGKQPSSADGETYPNYDCCETGLYESKISVSDAMYDFVDSSMWPELIGGIFTLSTLLLQVADLGTFIAVTVVQVLSLLFPLKQYSVVRKPYKLVPIVWSIAVFFAALSNAPMVVSNVKYVMYVVHFHL